MVECCSGYSCLHSGCTVLSYLSLTAGDKGIKCPSAPPRRSRGVDRQERHRLPRWLLCQLRFATACPSLLSLPPRAPGMPPQSDTLVGELERRHEVVTCRSKRLAAVVVLSRPGACCSPGLAGARGAPRQGPCRAVDGLPGKLLLPGSCVSSDSPGKLLLPGHCSLRVAFPASSSCRGLGSNTLFLNGPRGNH